MTVSPFTIHYLQRREADLYPTILALKPGKNKVVSIKKELNEIKVLLSCTIFQTDGKTYKLIAFQNVNEALDENEARAWHKLLSVMTHEIMNSVAPISSLADTLKNRLQDSKNNNGTDTQSSLEDIELGIDTIKHRSESLISNLYQPLKKCRGLSELLPIQFSFVQKEVALTGEGVRTNRAQKLSANWVW